jgi:hypothetical protein
MGPRRVGDGRRAPEGSSHGSEEVDLGQGEHAVEPDHVDAGGAARRGADIEHQAGAALVAEAVELVREAVGGGVEAVERGHPARAVEAAEGELQAILAAREIEDDLRAILIAGVAKVSKVVRRPCWLTAAPLDIATMFG